MLGAQLNSEHLAFSRSNEESFMLQEVHQKFNEKKRNLRYLIKLLNAEHS